MHPTIWSASAPVVQVAGCTYVDVESKGIGLDKVCTLLDRPRIGGMVGRLQNDIS